MEIDRLPNTLLYGETAGTQVFEFADVGAVWLVVAEQGPYLLYLFLFDPHHPAANRRRKEFVQAGAKIVAVEIGYFKIHQAKRMGAVTNYLDAFCMGHIT